MGLLEDLAEKRIRTAMEEGDFDGLPGQGQPLEREDDALVPEDMRVAYRVLKNAGYLPEELALRREIADVRAILDQALDAEERLLAGRRLAWLRMRLGMRGGDRSHNLGAEYDARIRRRLAREP